MSWLLWKIRLNVSETISISHLCPRSSHLDASDPKLCVPSCYCTGIYTSSLYEIRLLLLEYCFCENMKTISALLPSPFDNLASFGQILREFMICKTNVAIQKTCFALMAFYLQCVFCKVYFKWLLTCVGSYIWHSRNLQCVLVVNIQIVFPGEWLSYS